METQTEVKAQEQVDPRVAAIEADEKHFAAKEQKVGKDSRFSHLNATLQILYEKYPKCFIKEGTVVKPLKVGILEDLKAKLENGEIEGVTISKLRGAVRIYTTRLRYYDSVKEGVARIDLDGNESGDCTAEHEKYASDCFAEIVNKRKTAQAKKAANARKGKKPFNKGGKRPFNKGGFNKGGFNKGGFNKGPRKPRTVPATRADLTVGREVLVTSTGRVLKGVVVEEPTASAVKVSLDDGKKVIYMINRVMIPQK